MSRGPNQTADQFRPMIDGWPGLRRLRSIQRDRHENTPWPVLKGYQCVNKPVCLPGFPSNSGSILAAIVSDTYSPHCWWSLFLVNSAYMFFFPHTQMLVPILTPRLKCGLNMIDLLSISYHSSLGSVEGDLAFPIGTSTSWIGGIYPQKLEKHRDFLGN